MNLKLHLKNLQKSKQKQFHVQCSIHKSYKMRKWTTSCIGNFEENMDLSRIYLAVVTFILMNSPFFSQYKHECICCNNLLCWKVSQECHTRCNLRGFSHHFILSGIWPSTTLQLSSTQLIFHAIFSPFFGIKYLIVFTF